MLIESVMLFNHLILCRPFLLLPSIFPSITVFPSESALHIRWSFSFSISPFSEFSGLIFFGIDWFDLLAVQGTPKTVLQHHNLKASVLQCSASHIGTWLLEKPKWTFVDEVMSLLFRTLSRFFIAFFKVKVLVAKPCPTLC